MNKEYTNYWTITDSPDVKTSEIINEMEGLFKVWHYLSKEELDEQFPPPEKITTRYFLSSVEPDLETMGKSAIEADPNQTGISIRERMLMEIQYFKKTGEHLDIKGWTICTGSRYAGGGVPRVYWDPCIADVHVDWCSLDYSHPLYGLRSAILPSSLPSSLNSLSLESAIEIVKKEGYVIYKPIT